jgi:hypothetical protein
LSISRDAETTFRGVQVKAAHLAGVQIARQGMLSGAFLEVIGNPIGVNIQKVPEGYDFFLEVTQLRMEDNDVPFDSSALMVPDPLDWME